jgi:catalase
VRLGTRADGQRLLAEAVTVVEQQDAHVAQLARPCRLGLNHTQLPVKSPKGVPGGARSYGRDGHMRFDDNGGRSKNYEPNGYDGPAQTGEACDLGYDASGSIGRHGLVKHKEDDDFVQASSIA